MVRMSGREMPAETLARILPLEDDPAGAAGRGHPDRRPSCASSCSTRGAPGLHFYTLNRSKATREIFAALQLPV